MMVINWGGKFSILHTYFFILAFFQKKIAQAIHNIFKN